MQNMEVLEINNKDYEKIFEKKIVDDTVFLRCYRHDLHYNISKDGEGPAILHAEFHNYKMN